MNLSELKRVLPQEDIEWRVQSQGLKRDGSPWAKIVPYVQNRAIMDILDEVCGPENWRNEFVLSEWLKTEKDLIKQDTGFLCGISIRIDGEWVTKWDGAEKSDIESFKGGLSNAMKRTAVQWGIGRFLYGMEEQWAVFSEDGIYNTKMKDDGKWYKWSPPFFSNWGIDTTVVHQETVKEPSISPSVGQTTTGATYPLPIESLTDKQRREIQEWGMKIAEGNVAEYKKLLVALTAFKDVPGLDDVARIQGKRLEIAHHKMHKKYNETFPEHQDEPDLPF